MLIKFNKNRFITNFEKLYLSKYNYEIPTCYLIRLKESFNNCTFTRDTTTFDEFCSDLLDLVLSNEYYYGLIEMIDDLRDTYNELDEKQIREVFELC